MSILLSTAPATYLSGPTVLENQNSGVAPLEVIARSATAALAAGTADRPRFTAGPGLNLWPIFVPNGQFLTVAGLNSNVTITFLFVVVELPSERGA